MLKEPNKSLTHSVFLTSSSFCYTSRVTLVPKPGTRKSSHHYAAVSWVNGACRAGKISWQSPPLATWGADGHQKKTGESPVGSSKWGRPAGHPELAGPGGSAGRGPSYRPCPAGEEESTRWPRGIYEPLRKDSGGMWVGLCSVASALDPAAVAQQLPVEKLLAYADLKWAILQRVGCSPEHHRQQFRSVDLGDSGRPFILAQQLRDACCKWLMAETCDISAMVDLVVLEQFVAQLPHRTAECHHSTSLNQAMQLDEDHLMACPGVGEFPSNLCLSLPKPSLSLFRPTTAPRLRGNAPLRAAHRGAVVPGEQTGVTRAHVSNLLPLSANLLALLMPLGWGEILGRPAGGAGIRDISRISVL